MQAHRRVLMLLHKQMGDFIFPKRLCSSSIVPISEIVEKRNHIFSQEQKRQLEEVGRVEKITVEVSGPPEDVSLVMNENISTPYDCCKHISLALCQRSPLALINETLLWDMHRPLPANCRLKLLSFRDKDPYSLNHAFWRTGSLVLGAVISKSFKDEVGVRLHSFPEPNVSSGSFIYDVGMKLEMWQPTLEELKILSGEFLKFVSENHKIERLSVKKSVALEIFEGCPYKQAQIPQIAAEAEDHLVTLYRVGDHIDISTGPMIGDTSFFGRCSVASVHLLHNTYEPIYRFQAVALPKGILLNSYAFGILIRRAERLNEAEIPYLIKHAQPYGNHPAKNSDMPIPPKANIGTLEWFSFSVLTMTAIDKVVETSTSTFSSTLDYIYYLTTLCYNQISNVFFFRFDHRGHLQ